MLAPCCFLAKVDIAVELVIENYTTEIALKTMFHRLFSTAFFMLIIAPEALGTIR